MKLYYSPGSGSMAAHIVLEESGVHYQAIRVNLKEKRTADGQDYSSINPKGYVPCVQLNSGQVICENAALLPFLGELNPAAHLLPPHGTMENYRVREWTTFVNVELHKNMSPLFRPTTPEAWAQNQREVLKRRYTYTNERLGAGPFLTGAQFTVADAYLFVVLLLVRAAEHEPRRVPEPAGLLQECAGAPGRAEGPGRRRQAGSGPGAQRRLMLRVVGAASSGFSGQWCRGYRPRMSLRTST